MSQIVLLVIELIILSVLLLVLYKIKGKEGIYIFSSIAIVLTSITSLKIINLYEFDVNLGIIPMILFFTSSNILIQKGNPDDTKTVLLISITSLLVSYIVLYLVSLMNASNINLFTSASYDNILEGSIRTFFAVFVTILYSTLLNNKIYYYLKKIKNNILVSNLFTTIIIQFIASIIFCLITNIFTKEPLDIIKMIMIRYLVSLCVGILSTVIIYISKFIKIKE